MIGRAGIALVSALLKAAYAIQSGHRLHLRALAVLEDVLRTGSVEWKNNVVVISE
jgi:hypothetical protein